MYFKTQIINLDTPIAGTEYDQELPDDMRKMVIRSRLLGTLKFAFTETESGTNYITVPAGTTFMIDNIYTKDLTLFVQSNKTDDVIEMLIFKD